MKFALLLLFVVSRCTSSVAQTPVERLVLALPSADFDAVYQVKDSLINYQQAAIPALIKFLRDTSFVKLQNTADLIYPGETEFYGHGWIVDYDLDWVAVRAAWLLEELTFLDFGYQDKSITEAMLLDLHQRGYQTYLHDGFHAIDFRNKTPRDRLKLYRLGLAEQVTHWWDQQKGGWTRYKALREALASDNEHRQALAIQYLRFGKTRCAGLSLTTYESELKPLLIRIKHSTSREALQANYALKDLADKESYWLTSKSISSSRQ